MSTGSPTGDGRGIRVDDERLHLPAGLPPQEIYDILLNGQHVWSIQPERDAVAAGRAGAAVPWPKAMRRHLVGRAGVVLREHLSGEVVGRTDHVFAGAETEEVSVVDRHGNPLVMDKWGQLIRPLSSDSAELIDELMDQVVALMETITTKAGLPAFICYGTLLGAVRNGKLIGHDNDIDLAYASARTHPADIIREGYHVERTLREEGWVVRRGSGVRLNVRLRLSDNTVRFVDVFTAAWVEDILYIPSDTGFRLPRETVLPLTTVELLGRQVPAPADPETLLAATYGEGWRSPDPSFKYETPTWLTRRFTGWWGGLTSGRKQWDSFAKDADTVVPDEPTPFARWVAEHYPSDRPLVDLGAGTGRDSVWFAEQGREVTALDYSVQSLRRTLRRHEVVERGLPVTVENLNLYDLRAVLSLGARLSRAETPHDLYARFTFHSLMPVGRDHVFRLASMALRRGGHLFLEFRTPKDRGLPKLTGPGQRYYVRPADVRRNLKRLGATVLDEAQGTGLAPLGDEDPYVCRMVATWV